MITRFAWRISAVAAVIAFVGVLLFVARRDASWIDLRVPDGQTETLAWADGSMVRLIGPAFVEYSPVDAEHPRPEFLRLSGDAYFDIVPADAKFAVETRTAVVTVLGTSFGVRSVPDRTDVVLASGRVSVTSRTALESVCLLSPSKACFVIEDQPPSSPREVNLSEALGWADLFVFRGTAVSEIAAALSTYYDLEVAVDTKLEETEITGTFERSRGIKEILEVLSRTLDARAVETSTGFRLVQGQE